jgi:hypothetical protein
MKQTILAQIILSGYFKITNLFVVLLTLKVQPKAN